MTMGPRMCSGSRAPTAAEHCAAARSCRYDPFVSSSVDENRFPVIDLGFMGYAQAYAEQERHHGLVLAARPDVHADEDDAARPGEFGPAGVLLTVEHPSVITVSRRPGAAEHVLASREWLRTRGVEVAQTDRGGDVTYHGPGQLVVYPIIDLQRLGLGLHEYMRLLEQSVIDACAAMGVAGERDPTATGVWVRGPGAGDGHDAPLAKIAAFGVRVRRWISMHGLALNVRPDLTHFSYIVPCGLAGRPVTSVLELLGEDRTPSMSHARDLVVGALRSRLRAHADARARGIGA